MPHTENARGSWTHTRTHVLLGWPILLIVLILCESSLPNSAIAETAALKEIRVGDHVDYIRIVFELSKPIQYQLEDDAGTGLISVRFLDTTTNFSDEAASLKSACLNQVTLSAQDDQVLVVLYFNPVWNKFNPFNLREPDRMVLDVFCYEASGPVQPQSDIQLESAGPLQEVTPDKISDAVGAIPTLIDPQPDKTETSPSAAAELYGLESTAPPATITGLQSQDSIPITGNSAESITNATAANERNDPFQKYLLFLLAAITGIIIILIALIIIQKKNLSGGPNAVIDNQHTVPDETMRTLDSQIKAKLMKYDDQ